MVGVQAIFKLPSLSLSHQAPKGPSIMNTCICDKSSKVQTNAILRTELVTCAYSGQFLWLAEKLRPSKQRWLSNKDSPWSFNTHFQLWEMLAQMLLHFCPLPFFAEWVNSMHLYRWYWKYPNLNFPVLYHQHAHNLVRIDSPLEDLVWCLRGAKKKKKR